MAENMFKFRSANNAGSFLAVSPVTPNDDTPLEKGVARCLFVGVGGTVVIEDQQGTAVTLQSNDAQYHPIFVSKVRATGTTASGLVALY